MRVETDSGVATLWLSRPDRLNALTFEEYAALVAWFRAPPAGVRAVVLTGEGRAFCSGGDVEDIIGQLFSRDMEGLLAFTRMTVDLVRAMRSCRAPIIAAVNGVAAGAGAIIAMASDLRVASPRGRVAFLFNKVGLCGADMGAAHLLPRIVGLGRASEMLLLGDTVDAESALRAGLFNRVVPEDTLLDEARAMAARIAAGPAFANGMTKEALNRELDVSLDTALEMEAQAQAICMAHPDFRAAYEAWKAKKV
ncbi:MAG: enoyl-CoA hydratase family protein [Deltaproteobacteria bacterium]|nr:enoyl-CoA hydratase family protein [Deltaproteobacteria bacterium]